MPEGYHPPVEEYLEAVHELTEDGVPVIQARLAERLGHSAPTVSETIRRLRDEGYVEIEGRTITLTKTGKVRAESVVRKHRLAERLLTDIIGLEWHKAHMEATRWEHVISDEVEARIVELLHNPTTCPHGNPIPGTPGHEIPLAKLSDAEVGDEVRLERVTEQVEFETSWLTYLGENGFRPGTVAIVSDKTADGSMTLLIDNKPLAIESRLAKLLYVAA
jgi:DtxR family transcriptional regulator, Mn-dependent transcriptional regulator